MVDKEGEDRAGRGASEATAECYLWHPGRFQISQMCKNLEVGQGSLEGRC